MKRYITSRKSAFMVVSTMAGTGKKLYDLAFWSLAHNIVNIVYYFCELFAFACNAKSFAIAFLVFSLFPSCH